MSDEAWREFWSGEGSAEQAIGGAHRPLIAEHWRKFFRKALEGAPGNLLIADIAAGTGAALALAAETAGSWPHKSAALAAFDISGAAVRATVRKVAGSIGAVADASRLPVRDRSVDIIVSQFGAEYAGLGAFAEAARCLAEGGELSTLSHYAGGGIDAECAANAALIERIAAIGVSEAAANALKETYVRRRLHAADLFEPRLEKKLKRALSEADHAVADAPLSAAQSMYRRYLNDLGALVTRRRAYDERDALGWLEGMQRSHAAYRERMASMRRAALDADAVRRISEAFAAAGLAGFSARPFVLVDGAAPAAWIISARRPIPNSSTPL